jgi:hypothetical protein
MLFIAATPVETFMAVANATAALVGKAPPYVSYRVTGTLHILKGDAAIDRRVVVRTVDGDAVISDEKGRTELKPPFPAPPNFDALSDFKLAGFVSATYKKPGQAMTRDIDLRVVNIKPLTYRTDSPVHADVVARSLRDYTVEAVDDESGTEKHLRLTPRPAYYPHHTYWMHDVWYDPATMIASRVLWKGNDDFTLDARYTTVDGQWMLRSIDVGRILRPIGLFRVQYAFHGDYAEYRFSDVSPDPRLVPSPAPTASPGA